MTGINVNVGKMVALNSNIPVNPALFRQRIYICVRFLRGEGIDSVAQLVEQYTFNVWVSGSNPDRITV